jgi:hypothetical protein
MLLQVILQTTNTGQNEHKQCLQEVEKRGRYQFDNTWGIYWKAEKTIGDKSHRKELKFLDMGG